MRRFRGSRLALAMLFAAGLVAPGMTAAAARHAVPDAVGMEPVFNTPAENGDRDHAIQQRLIELVDGTPAGASIDFSVYSWTMDPVAEALKRAQARGVKVRIAIDGGADDNPENTPTKILKSANLSKLVFCGTGGDQTGCIADRGAPHSINHNKLWMFSETQGMEDVVVVSSYNLTNSQGNLFNNALIMHGDPDLYAYYRGHVDRMLAQRKDNDYFDNGGYHKSPDSLVTSYLSPRADSNGGGAEEFATDTWAQLLKWITKYESGCELDVAHANIADTRTAVVSEIARIGKLGCEVRVVYGTIGPDSLSKLQGKPNISIKRYSDNDADNVDGREVSIHSKYMLYRGHYNATAKRSIVFTGSHNLSGAALRSNDEILIKVENPEVSTAYLGNFESIWGRAKCTAPKVGSCP